MNRRQVLCIAVAVGCSEAEDRTSGVDGDKVIIELSADELNTLCAYIEEISGPARSVECNGTSVTTGVTKERCISNSPTAAEHPTCRLSVAEYERCYEYLAQYTDDVCHIPPSDACNAFSTPACN